MSTPAELHAEIKAFVPLVTECEGSAYPWRHFPERIIDGVTRVPSIRCGCGKVFEAHAWEAPSNQPAPELWASFEKFKMHIQEVKDRQFEKWLCESSVSGLYVTVGSQIVERGWDLHAPSAALLQFEADREQEAVGG